MDGAHNWIAGGGTAQAQTATYSPAITGLYDGLHVCWKPTAANTAAAPSFSPNGLTAHPIVKAGGALVANDIITTAQACAIYNTTGTQWELQNPQTTAAGGFSCSSGNCGILLPFGNPAIATINGTPWNNPGSNSVQAALFNLPFTLSVTKIDILVTTAIAASNCLVGVYDNTGNTLLLTSGAISSAATGVKTTTITTVVLNPGFYYSAIGCTDSGVGLIGAVNATGNIELLLDTSFGVAGKVANSISGTTLPATLGAFANNADNLGIAWIHP